MKPDKWRSSSYKTPRFITAFITALQYVVSGATSIQSTSFWSKFVITFLILLFSIDLRLSSGIFHSEFPVKDLSSYMLRPSHIPWFNHLNVLVGMKKIINNSDSVTVLLNTLYQETNKRGSCIPDCNSQNSQRRPFQFIKITYDRFADGISGKHKTY
jgi:hypothetical protein